MVPYQLRHVRLSLAACLLLLAVSSLVSAVPARAAERAEPTGSAFDTLSPDGLKTLPYPGDAVDANAMTLAAAGKGEDSRLDGTLLALASGNLASADAQVTRDDGGRVQVQITVSPDQLAAASAAVANLGGSITGQSLDKTLLQGFMPVENLKALASQNVVQFVAVPEHFTGFGELQVGVTTTEGVAISNAATWHTAGFRGAGVRVAIIDGGFQGYNSLLGSDLPASVTAVNFVDTGTVTDGGPHGTACAEIVYDMAPSATYYLLRINSTIDLQEAVTYAIAQGVRVISVSGGFYNVTPGDGTGFFANEVQRAANAGILWANAASNDREAHWGGSYADADGDSSHEFGGYEINCFGPSPGSCYSIPAGFGINVYLRWNNWTAPVNQDYDLYIVRFNTTTSSWQIIGQGINLQNGGAGQRPTEYAGAVTSGGNTAYGVVIRRYNASGSANFELFTPKFSSPMVRTTSRSLANLSDAPAAITVAALHSVSPYAQESYSSEGPTNGPGGAAAGGIIKPDLSAWANVNTRAYGTTVGSKFNGTSAATPHVAGALALVRGAYPNFSWAQVRSFLFGRAIDIGVGGRDNQFGYGRLWLGPPKLMRYEYNGDKRSDILWRNLGTGANAIWYLNGAVIGSGAIPTVADLNWRIVGGGDFDGNGRSDILWRHSVSGSNAIWFMSGTTVASSKSLPGVSNASWRIVATGDFNGDGRSDILWRYATTGALAIWFMNGATVLSGPGLATVATSWQTIGTGDFNGDGRSDILWRNSSGSNAVWLMNGTSVTSLGVPAVADANWRIVGTGDRSNDGRSDILWRNFATGSNAIWYMSGGTVIGSTGLPAVGDTRWQVGHDADVNGDGRADIVWRHATAGSNAVWLMNGGTVVSSLALPAVTDTRWRIQGNATAGTAPADVGAAEAAGPPEDLVVSDEIVTLEAGSLGEALAVEPSDSTPPLDETLVDVPGTDFKTYLMLVAR